MKIALIGMSNSGKTYWSKKLEEIGFIRFSCDDLIEQKLKKSLKQLGFSGIADVANWLGQPYQKRYQRNSNKYLELERQSMEGILTKIEKQYTNGEKIVVDTTGSVIYTGEDIMSRLKKITRIVYLNTPLTVRRKMYQSYLKNPKPVIWDSCFSIKRGQKPLQALKKCYPKLLLTRCLKYQKYADYTFDHDLLRSHNFEAKNFYDSLSKY